MNRNTDSPLTLEVHCRDRILLCGPRTLVMGILNVTPDSFSDGGQFQEFDRAVAQGRKMADEGADIIDIGGESTRPGADPVSPEEEQRRILPVIQALAKETDRLLSVDTRNSGTAQSAIAAGAHLINDVSGLRHDPGILKAAAETGAGLLLMHSRATPKDMQEDTRYDDLLGEVRDTLRAAMARADEAGVREDQILIDPGLGFSKTVEHNYLLIKHLAEFSSLGRPILVGPSRKSFIGKTLDKAPEDRMWGTAATVAAAILNGAHIVRVHEVAPMLDVCRVTDAIRHADDAKAAS